MARLLFASIALLAIATAADANSIRYIANLNGANENPPVISPGTGTAIVDFDIMAHTMHVHVDFSGLTAPDEASHIHCCVPEGGNAGVATQTPALTGFPLGVTSGTFDGTFDTSLATTYNPSFVTANGGTPAGAEAVLAAGLASRMTYYDIHTSFAPGGEIRGLLQAQAVPLPASFPMGVSLLGCLFIIGRLRLRKPRIT